jgi:hypothetical protein
MHTFRVRVTAGEDHPNHPVGFDATGIVVVDSRDHEAARQMALDRLQHLGWSDTKISGAILLAEDLDASTLSPLMLQALSVARDITVAVVIYPPRAT